MGVQFFRVQSYGATAKKGSRSRTADSVLAEAMRVEGHAPHVPKPREPEVLFGNLDAIGDEIARLAREGKAEKVRADGSVTTRKLHANAPTLAAAVLSYPGATPALLNEWKLAMKAGKPPASFTAFERWKKLTLEWLRSEWGDKFKAAVVHWDESHPHIHAYAVAEQRVDGVVDLTGLHVGRDAKQNARKLAVKGETASEAATRQKVAYVEAMKAIQDRYNESVGKRCGQARFGPKRRRMSRGEWKAEKQRLREEAALHAKIERQAEHIAALEQKLNPPKPTLGGHLVPPPLRVGARAPVRPPAPS